MTQGAYFPPGDCHPGHIEELDVGGWFTRDLLDDLHGIRALNLESVDLSNDRPQSGGGSLVTLYFRVIAARFAVILNPIVYGRASNEVKQIRIKAEKNHVADHITFIVTCHKLLGFVGYEALETVYAKIG